MLRVTPFHQRTSALVEGQAWRRWAGYTVASSYDLVHDREYTAIRSSAALLDVSPLYKYIITGKDCARLLDRMVTRDITKCKIGQVMYTTWCDGSGKVIDDGTVTRLSESSFRLTSAEPNLRWLAMNSFGLAIDVEDISERVGTLALQGPLSRAILSGITEPSIEALKFFRAMETTIRGVPVSVSRTGYTGDLGYEIWIPAESAIAVWDALTEAGTPYGITPAGIWALDMARIEAGLIMLDVDYHSSHHALIEQQKSTPYELGLDWTVNLDKGPFNGKRALVAEHAREPQWRLVGIDVDWVSLEGIYGEWHLPPLVPTVAWRSSTPIYRSGYQVGYASSGCWSPLLKKYIALAHVEAAHARPGTPVEMEVTVEHQRRRAKAIVAKTPFFDPERKRA
ncbi:MAG: aminomethyltransferase family protein [Gemmatimonadota bacterium]